MIKLEVQPYCADCLDFEASVKEPQKIVIRDSWDNSTGETMLTDTIIRCKHAKRCENIKRYLEQKLRGEVV